MGWLLSTTFLHIYLKLAWFWGFNGPPKHKKKQFQDVSSASESPWGRKIAAQVISTGLRWGVWVVRLVLAGPALPTAKLSTAKMLCKWRFRAMAWSEGPQGRQITYAQRPPRRPWRMAPGHNGEPLWINSSHDFLVENVSSHNLFGFSVQWLALRPCLQFHPPPSACAQDLFLALLYFLQCSDRLREFPTYSANP